MPRIGLIVEGPYDEAVICVLVAKLRPRATTVVRLCRGSITGKLAGILNELNHKRPRFEKVIVVSDADGQEPRDVRRAINKELIRCYFPVIPIVIVQELEAWLIADSRALRTIVGANRIFASPERIRDPKAELTKLFPRRENYTPARARLIAEAIDLALLRQRCPAFASFREAVLDP